MHSLSKTNLMVALQQLGLLLFLVIVFGCDVFFNMPLHPNPTLFTYKLVNVPVQVMYLGPGKLVKVTCDWMTHFTQHLHQGWKLIDIFWDQGKRSHGGIIMIALSALLTTWAFVSSRPIYSCFDKGCPT